MTTIAQAYESLGDIKRRKVAVARADSEDALIALRAGYDQGLISAVLVGESERIKEAASLAGVDISVFKIFDTRSEEASIEAVKLVSSGQADIVMKGLAASGEFLKAVLDREVGIRKEGSSLSAIAVMQADNLGRLLFITDPGITPSPDLAQKVKLIRNAVPIAQAFGVKTPKVAALCAAESVSPKIQSTVDAARLQEMSGSEEIFGALVAGPISLDLAISEHAALEKGYESPVAGKADILLAPSIEAANILYKSLTYFAGMKTGGVMAGAAAPIIFTSRTDSAQTKLNTIAFAAFLAKGCE
ncbi:MAG: phosphate butyryltransferase [Clostridiales bacterium]|jgi:phosphate butyryltransferase|nr:phosphate butyryltransferase [Clostridiales bacterium]